MDWFLLAWCLAIFAARVLDVSIGTLRTFVVVGGHKGLAWLLGVTQMMIWVLVAAQVVPTIPANPLYAVFYAMGFATGCFVGMSIESWLALGDRRLMIFSRHGDLLANYLRGQSFAVTTWSADSADGPTSVVFVKLARAQVAAVSAAVHELDPACVYTVDRVDGSARPTLVPTTGWRQSDKKGK